MPAPHISEAEFQQQVVELAQLRGWRVMHARRTRAQRGDGTTFYHTPIQGHPGFPDLVLARADRPVLFAELKSATGRLTADQRAWGDVLDAAEGADYYLWLPRDWPEIEEALE